MTVTMAFPVKNTIISYLKSDRETCTFNDVLIDKIAEKFAKTEQYTPKDMKEAVFNVIADYTQDWQQYELLFATNRLVAALVACANANSQATTLVACGLANQRIISRCAKL